MTVTSPHPTISKFIILGKNIKRPKLEAFMFAKIFILAKQRAKCRDACVSAFGECRGVNRFNTSRLAALGYQTDAP